MLKNFFSKKKVIFPEIFLKFFLKKGNFKKAEINLKNLFKILFDKTNLGQYSVLTKLYKILYINFELRKIKKFRSSHIIIVPIKQNRRHFLIFRYLFDAIKRDKRNVSTVTKLVTEILKCIQNKESEVIKLKTLTKDLAFKNRSNVHYRWY